MLFYVQKNLVLCLLYQTHYLKVNTPLTSLDDCQYIAPLSNVAVYKNVCCQTLFGHAIILFWTCPNSCTFSKEGREIKKEKRRRNTAAENSKGKQWMTLSGSRGEDNAVESRMKAAWAAQRFDWAPQAGTCLWPHTAPDSRNARFSRLLQTSE